MILSKWSRFNKVYSRDNLLKEINDGAYIIKLDEIDDIGTHWVLHLLQITNISKRRKKNYS